MDASSCVSGAERDNGPSNWPAVEKGRGFRVGKKVAPGKANGDVVSRGGGNAEWNVNGDRDIDARKDVNGNSKGDYAEDRYTDEAEEGYRAKDEESVDESESGSEEIAKKESASDPLKEFNLPYIIVSDTFLRYPFTPTPHPPTPTPHPHPHLTHTHTSPTPTPHPHPTHTLP